ncbi:hypothetical protein [Variovorax sp. YR216]|uniref:hypothetical protein n=1 Tax=Variovorax sp. YR216 TaxID=1882828 RepID=UPI00115FA6AB|nr:hypothetical protein [Variovorax sp. YR216]
MIVQESLLRGRDEQWCACTRDVLADTMLLGFGMIAEDFTIGEITLPYVPDPHRATPIEIVS